MAGTLGMLIYMRRKGAIYMNLDAFKMFDANEYREFRVYMTYEYYDGLYDESAYMCHAIGVKDGKELVIARWPKEILRSNYDELNISRYFGYFNYFHELVNEINSFNSRYGRNLDLKLKTYSGVLVDIDQVVLDYELKRIVLVTTASVEERMKLKEEQGDEEWMLY